MKAVIKNGTILPQEPFPKDWQDGTELLVEKFPTVASDANEWDRWMATVQSAADAMDPEDEIILEETLREARDQARELARKA